MRALLLFAVLGCGSSERPAPSPPVPGLEIPAALLPARGMLLVGDLHGTREIPAFVGQLVASASVREPVALLLEWPADENPSLQTYLASNGDAASRRALVAGSGWQNPYQDGRRSVAMVELLDTVRALRASGRKIDVIGFDATANDPDREEVMAKNVIAARRARPDEALIVYAGNLHTSLREAPFRPGYAWMAMRVAKAGIPLASINARWPDGTAWICPDGEVAHCGVAFLGGKEAAPGIHIESLNNGQYDGWFGLATVTASPPAGIPDAAVGFDDKIAAAAKSPRAQAAKGRRAYEAKRYGECADLLAQVTSPDAGTLYDHACCLALDGRKDEAFVKLDAAIAAGFTDLAHVAADPDLASLRDDPRWPVKR